MAEGITLAELRRIKLQCQQQQFPATTPTNPMPLPINQTLAFGGQMAGSAGPKITTPAAKKVTPVAPTYAFWSSKPSGNLNEKLEATTKDLDTTTENLKVEKHFTALVDKEKASLKKDFDGLKEQVKNFKHSYLEAKSEDENSKEDLEEAKAELELTRGKLKEA
ncbi:hypothetical protein SESBI_43864 [Sesbania bispinosa]|nr:hypothetical protein SESBI_43864 [Sesbania bispinosa]